MSKINNIEQLTIEDITKSDLRLMSSIKHQVTSISGGFGEITVKFTIRSSKITNARYIRIEENDNIGL